MKEGSSENPVTTCQATRRYIPEDRNLNTYCAYINLNLRKPIRAQLFLISNLRRVFYVVFFLFGDSPASEFYVPTFRNTLSIPSSIGRLNQTYEDGTVFVGNVGT
jgi:hypothetical protein